ncbi:hypothetical protein BH18VER1_BH18VER1_12020 [soil metagenome]
MLLAAVLALAPMAQAYVYDTREHAKWQGSTIPVVVQLGRSSELLRDGSVSFDTSFENAMMLWNEQIASAQFTWTESPRTSEPRSDGITTVSFESRLYGEALGTRTLAVTYVQNEGTRMTETDIAFNTKYFSFNSYLGPIGNPQDLHRIALHELGHALGLDHPNQADQKIDAVMNSRITDQDRLTLDDISGAQSLYGAAPNAPSPRGNARLANISTRGLVGTGDNVMIGGFIIDGGTKKVLIRALGPSLGIGGSLSDPVLELHNAKGDVIATNDNWKSTQEAAIAGTSLSPGKEEESAIVMTLDAGSYTAVVSGHDAGTGLALVEVYDLAPASGRLVNIATRGNVAAGDDVMIGGFIMNGPQSKFVVVRGLGPSLREALPDALPTTTLELRNGDGALILSNTGWKSVDNGYPVSVTGLAPKDLGDSAIGREMMPGSYTVILKSPAGSTGTGLIEVYDIGL